MPGTVQVLYGLINEDITEAVAPTLGLILEKQVGRCEAEWSLAAGEGNQPWGSGQGCLTLTVQVS